MYNLLNPLTWWNKADEPPVTNTRVVRILEIHEIKLEVPKDIPYDRRREWAFLDAGQGKGRRTMIKRDYIEQENLIIIKEDYIENCED